MAAGYPVASGDLPGHGSGHSDLFTVANLQTCLASSLAALARRGHGEVIAIGHSLSGAMIGAAIGDLGTPLPPNLRGALLISPPFSLSLGPSAIVNELVYSVDRDLARELRRYGLWDILPALGPFKRRQFPIRLPKGSSYLAVVKRYLDNVQPRTGNSWRAAPRLPCMVMAGSKDLISSVADARRYSDWLGSELITIAGANHFTLPFKRRSISAIMEFCEAISDGRG